MRPARDRVEKEHGQVARTGGMAGVELLGCPDVQVERTRVGRELTRRLGWQDLADLHAATIAGGIVPVNAPRPCCKAPRFCE